MSLSRYQPYSVANRFPESRVGHIVCDFSEYPTPQGATRRPYFLIEAARPTIITSTPTNVTYPPGYVEIQFTPNGLFEICGYSTERQDAIITPISGQEHANAFKGYFCAQFDFGEFNSEGLVYGVIQDGKVRQGVTQAEGPLLSAFVFVPEGGYESAGVRVGTSFISIDQARSNMEEVSDGFDVVAQEVRKEWKDILERVEVHVGGEDDAEAQMMKEVFYTGIAHGLQVSRII